MSSLQKKTCRFKGRNGDSRWCIYIYLSISTSIPYIYILQIAWNKLRWQNIPRILGIWLMFRDVPRHCSRSSKISFSQPRHWYP
jgi:hypothetical protein